MSYHTADFPLPTPAPQIRHDGWSPVRQRLFIETLAETGVITFACDTVGLSMRSAYNLRNHRDGAAFRLGWDAAILIARTCLADDLLSRAILGTTETVRHDQEARETTRHRHDNRLAMSMLSRLDRMADTPAEGSDAALARIVAQDFAAFLDLICPPRAEDASFSPQPSSSQPEDPEALADDRTEPDPPHAVTALSPGASAALFIAARRALLAGTAPAANPPTCAPQQRCELRPEAPVDLLSLPPDQAATQLRGIWWDEREGCMRTDYPAPPGFQGEESHEIYIMEEYERALTPQEDAVVTAREKEQRRPYLEAATRARDAFFAFSPATAPTPTAGRRDQAEDEDAGDEDAGDPWHQIGRAPRAPE